MPGRWPRVSASLLLACATAACGKRGDPLPPLRRNPEPIVQLELAQRGTQIELAFVTPTRTVDGALLPVLEVELLISSEPGVLADVAEPIQLRAAPGERVVHTDPLPEPGTPLRFAVLTIATGKRSALSPESLLVVKPPPPPPTDVSVRLMPDGLSLTWTECVATTPDPALPEPEASVAEAEAAEETESEPDPGAANDTSAAEETTPAPPPPTDPSTSSERSTPTARRDALESSPAAGETGPGAEPGPPSGKPVAAGLTEVPSGPPQTASSGTGEPGAEEEVAGDPGEEEGDAAAEAPAAAAPAPAPSTGVRLYRRTADGEYQDPLLLAPLATEVHLDPGVEHGVEYCYTLRTVLRGEPVVEGLDSLEVCTTFLDQQPPAAPAGLSVLRREEAVELAWSPLAVDAERPASLRVYRAVGVGPLEALAELEGDATRWTDPSPPGDVVLEYALTASDEVGNESPPSPRARLIPR